jgi:hypothetical protein
MVTRMRRVFRRIGVGIAVATALSWLGCCTHNAYVAHRLSDLTDVAHVDVNACAFGFLVNVGPLILGSEELMSIPDGPAYQFRLGLGGLQKVRLGYKGSGCIWPLGRYEVERRYYGEVDSGWVHEGDQYWRHQPAWGSIGISGGFFFGVGAQVDVVEFADFVLGFFGYDITEDDLPEPQPVDPETAAREAAVREALERAAAAHRAEIEARSRRKTTE